MSSLIMFVFFFCVKQKTAYEMRISDWSSDVCSSDLVVSPIDDTPASRAGLQPGDLITHLEGESVQGMTLADAVEKMRGPPKTTLKVTIRRGEEAPFDVTHTRDIIRIQSVRSGAEKDIGYVRITRSEEHTPELQSLMRISY